MKQKKRAKRIMVRLAPGKDASPDEVRFTVEEKRMVEACARACGYPYPSTFVREVGVDAALATLEREGMDDYQVIKTASLECGLSLSEWLRLVTLAAAEHLTMETLQSHLGAARRFGQRLKAIRRGA